MAWKIKDSDNLLLSLGICCLLLLIAGWWLLRLHATPFLLAPMMSLDACLLAPSDTIESALPTWQQPCVGSNGSASHLVESTLQNLQPSGRMRQGLQLGYTLKVPVLALLKQHGQNWRVNAQAIDRIVRTVRDNPRKLILYLFSTHFSDKAPIEPILASNPDNLGYTPDGALGQDLYYGQPIYPWSIGRTDNPITQYRAQVMDALLKRLCTLPLNVRHRIQGITLLGEAHHLFPGFETGMGFDPPYRTTDYSTTSIAGFRQFLIGRYANIAELNKRLDSNYLSFASITPPSRDIRTQVLTRFEEHLDAYSTGLLPVSGWVYAPGTPTTSQMVRIYLDGTHLADTPVHLGRQDVSAAHPEFRTADLGWRHDIDFSKISAGLHRLDIALSQPGHDLVHLETRTISVMDKKQTTPARQPMAQLPPMQMLPKQITAFTDQPRDQASYYFNPMAREWQAFRETQVVEYLQHFNNLVTQTCFADTPRYTHQIVPQFNPSWNYQKYAVNASLLPMKTLRTGISLYGEASYGKSVIEWLKHSPHPHYGITEFHPLRAMNPQQLSELVQQHQDLGASFLSFFLDTQWQTQRLNPASNFFIFAIDPDNHQFGSDQLFTSFKTLLADQ